MQTNRYKTNHIKPLLCGMAWIINLLTLAVWLFSMFDAWDFVGRMGCEWARKVARNLASSQAGAAYTRHIRSSGGVRCLVNGLRSGSYLLG